MWFTSDRRTFLSSGGAIGVAAALPAAPKLGVSPKEFGAVGNGTANDLSAVLKAITHAFDNGHPVDGGELLYGVAGKVSVSKRLRPFIARLRLKQLSPTQGQNTLEFTDCEQIRIESLYVHTGDAKGVGHMENTCALQILRGSGHRIRNVEATGKGKVTYIRLWNTAESTLEHPYVHDGEFEDFEMQAASDDHPAFRVPDDVVQGIHLADNSALSIISPVIKNLLGNATYMNLSNEVVHFPNLRTRGICGGGNSDITILNPKVSNTDQAIDLSGNGDNWGNRNTQILGGHTRDCGSVGVKLSGAPVRSKVIGHTVENCGMMGFSVSGYDAVSQAVDNELIGCLVVNPGYNQIQADTDADPLMHCGFMVYEEGPDGVKGTRISDCRAIDQQGFYLEGDDQARWPSAGATSATMRDPWTGYTGIYEATFDTSDFSAPGRPVPRKETRAIRLTSGSKTVTWTGGLQNRIARPFVSRPPRMAYGYMAVRNNGSVIPYQSGRNRLVNAESIGHIVAARKGFPPPSAD